MVTLVKTLANGTVDGVIEITEPSDGKPGKFVQKIRDLGEDSLRVAQESVISRQSQVTKYTREAVEMGYVVK